MLFNAFRLKPLELAYNKAQQAGKKLANILVSSNVFCNCSINLMCFSLGSVVVQNCLMELEKLGAWDRINDVIFLGACQDSTIFEENKCKSVSGKIINVYTEEDSTLKYLFKFTQVGLTKRPLGLKKLESPYQEIVNYDVSDIVKGHLLYREKLKEILERIHYNRDSSIHFENFQ